MSAQCVKTMATGSELHKHEGVAIAQARLAAMSNQKAGRCTSSQIHKAKGFAEIGRCRPPAAAVHGKLPSPFERPLPSNAYLENFQTLLQVPECLVTSDCWATTNPGIWAELQMFV